MVTIYPRTTTGAVLPAALVLDRADVVVRHLGVGSWQIETSHSDSAALLATRGTGVVVVNSGVVVLSGPMTAYEAAWDDTRWKWTISGVGDGFLLNVLGWPVPGNLISSQSGAEAWVDTDVAETVMKGLVSANVVTRLGAGVTVATDQARGSSVTGRARMAKVLDLLRDWGMSGGVGWTCLDSGAGPVFDCFVPTDRTGSVLLTPQTGTLTGARYSMKAPRTTRVVVGGDGEGTARTFRERIDSTAEAAWGLVVEEFVDQRQTNVTAEMDQAGDKELAEAAEVVSLALTCVDVDGQRYGTDYQVGDTVGAALGSGMTVEDVVWEARLTLSNGRVTVSPTVGSPDYPLSATRLRDLGRNIRQLQEAF